jgi:hypothetical protein
VGYLSIIIFISVVFAITLVNDYHLSVPKYQLSVVSSSKKLSDTDNVYYTKTGTHYHTKDCTVDTQFYCTKQEAINKGLSSCKICNP